MDLIEGSETSANINQTLGIHPKIEAVSICCCLPESSDKIFPCGGRGLRPHALPKTLVSSS
jgi:hypothetical protein